MVGGRSGPGTAALDAAARLLGTGARRLSPADPQSGLSGRVWRLEYPGGAAMMRLFPQSGPRLRQQYRLLQMLAPQDLAPPVLGMDERTGVLLYEYLPGRSWSRRDLFAAHSLTALARRLARLHALNAAFMPRFDPPAAARDYAARLRPRLAGDALGQARIQRLLELAPHYGGRGVLRLCHNDPVCSNLLAREEGDEPTLLDWEYAGSGDPWFDLASVVVLHDLPPEAEAQLLAAYPQAPSPAAAHYAQLKSLAALLAWAWLALYDDGAAGRDAARPDGIWQCVQRRLAACERGESPAAD